MTQRSLFSYFSPKPAASPASSPITKKQTAIRQLTKISKKVDNDDFELSSASDSSSDEEEFKKLVSKEKNMKLNKLKDESYSENSDYYSEISEDEKPAAKKSKTKAAPKPKASPAKKATTPKAMSSKASVDFDAPLETNHAAIAKEASAAVSEEDLPKWLSTNLKDANKKRPKDEGYDPTTVYIPPEEENKFTPFQKQFWAIKRNNFNSIVMIRKGKSTIWTD